MYVWYFGKFDPIEYARLGVFEHDPMELYSETFRNESVWLVPGTYEE